MGRINGVMERLLEVQGNLRDLRSEHSVTRNMVIAARHRARGHREGTAATHPNHRRPARQAGGRALMTILVTEVYADAFKDSERVRPHGTRKAAEAMAGYDNRLAAMDTRLAVLDMDDRRQRRHDVLPPCSLKLFIH